MPAEIIYLTQKRNPENSGHIEASEVFDMMMRNFLNPNFKNLIITFVNKDKRDLTSLAIWLLKRRSFTADDIPKMTEDSSSGTLQQIEYA
jgi:hypothetical protein